MQFGSGSILVTLPQWWAPSTRDTDQLVGETLAERQLLTIDYLTWSP